MADDERARRTDEGREAFAVMMSGFQQVAQANVALAQRLELVVASNQALVASNQELSARVVSLCEHNATLQEQIGVLVQVLARRQVGAPPAPVAPGLPPGFDQQPDPIGAFGARVVNGALGHLLNPAGQQPRRGRGGPPGF